MRIHAGRHTVAVGLIATLGWLPAAAALAEEQRYQGRSLSDWAQLLGAPELQTRLQAVDALRLGFGVDAAPALLRALDDEDRSVRREAIRALASIRPVTRETVAALSKAMREPDPSVRRAAAAALGDVGAVSALILALKDPSPEVRRSAVRPLRRVITRAQGSPDPVTTKAVVLALADALKDSDHPLRRSSANSLSAIGPAAVDAVPALAEATKDSDPSVRDAAVEALGRIGGPAAVSALVQALKDPRTASLALRALASMGPAARDAVPALKELRSQDRSSRSAEVEAALGAIARD